MARADYLFRKDNADAIRAAIRLAPDDSVYYMRLAQFDEDHARALLETSLRLNHYNAQADIELGLRYEADGDPSQAEKLLLQAAFIDHTYLPRWSLANFYLRRDNLHAFWMWARKAAEMPANDIGALFDLCWRVSPDPDEITSRILNDNPDVVRQYLSFLVGRGQLPAAAGAAIRLLRDGSAEADRPPLLSLVNKLVAANDAGPAISLWHQLIQHQWVVADQTVPNNAAFARDPQPVSFDWTLPSYPGLHSWPGPRGLETEFTGKEPESCTIAEQTIALSPGNYTLTYSYHATGIPPETGIRWQIVDAKSGAVLAQSPDLSSNSPQQMAVDFSVGPEASLLRLRLLYQRALGTTHISGTLEVASTSIQTRRQK
ncbi:MAG TPA: hypothetical protein VMV57_15140 [Terracidiphilus sp.]|nr:hypothetical protein [Terracidiphilus sp.]